MTHEQLQAFADEVCAAYGVPRVPLLVSAVKPSRGQAVYYTWRVRGDKVNHPRKITVFDWDNVKNADGEVIYALSHELAHHVRNVRANSLRHDSAHGDLEDGIGLALSRMVRQRVATLPRLARGNRATGAARRTQTKPRLTR